MERPGFALGVRMPPKRSSCQLAVTGMLYVLDVLALSKLLMAPCGAKLNDGR